MRFIVAILISCKLCAIVSFEESMGPNYANVPPERAVFQKLYEKNNHEVTRKAEKPLIPRIIHQIWLGGELPKKYARFCKTWEEMNPGYEYKLWTDDDVADLEMENRELFDKSKNFGFKSDILRYELLKRYGGVYADTDFECLKPLDNFTHAHDFFAGLHDHESVGNAFIASRPGHPLIDVFIENIKRVKKVDLSPEEVIATTGPAFITDQILLYVTAHKSNAVCIYPCSFFYPFPHTLQKEFWSGKITPGQLKTFLRPESSGIHYWATSWQ
ncbi:MAG: hypothetical protein SP1CHLAM54_12210 [Chlamydiia bacterium]|nr:hypothetical protein [Chlamydiia bacterium]MCH9616119.1 hypothetical protein [Chlamydiia bacterium]MCH9629458.1 hypothetical protein [Chlamydiia bacterium]